MKIIVINGPNMNVLGKRDKNVYGEETLDELNAYIAGFAKERNIDIDFFQSNHEGDIIDKIQASDGIYDGGIINPAAYTHYSIAIRDSIEAVSVPFVEVHMSDISSREPFRAVSVTEDVCIKQIAGQGKKSYLIGLFYLLDYLNKHK